jgi:Family of unknown function (DUF6481)
MTAFKQPDFLERQGASIKAKKEALEKFRAKAADPALADRLTGRAERAAMRSAVNAERQIKKDENKVRDSERKRRAESDAALDAERAKIESADRERALKAEQRRRETPAMPPANRAQSLDNRRGVRYHSAESIGGNPHARGPLWVISRHPLRSL